MRKKPTVLWWFAVTAMAYLWWFSYWNTNFTCWIGSLGTNCWETRRFFWRNHHWFVTSREHCGWRVSWGETTCKHLPVSWEDASNYCSTKGESFCVHGYFDPELMDCDNHRNRINQDTRIFPKKYRQTINSRLQYLHISPQIFGHKCIFDSCW